MIFGLLYFCVVILCVNRSRSSFILYRIVKRHSRQSNVRRIWTCADNDNQVANNISLGLCIYQCRLLITFANSLEPDQARRIVRPDQGPSCLTF